MDDNSHVFLIKDKIRCIQKKIMDQLAADLNSALNDTSIVTTSSSLSNVQMTFSNPISKIKRRRKRPTNNDNQRQNTDASDSTTPENNRSRNNNEKQSMESDGDDLLMKSKTESSMLNAASESDSTSKSDEIRRRRRTFKKPILPSSKIVASKSEQQIKTCRNSKPYTTITTDYSLHRSRRNCRSKSVCRMNNIDENPSTVSSSSFSFALNHTTNLVGKRKRSRATIHDDFRIRNNFLHECDMTCIDDNNLTNFSSSSSLNLSDSDKDPCLTSNEADDEQSDWPRDEISVPNVISWWKNADADKSKVDNDDDDDDDDDEKMLTTTDGTLQKIVDGALSMMLASSKTAIQNRIKTFVQREMLTGNRRNIESKNSYTHIHPKRHVRVFKEARRSHHNSYSHKRVKNDHIPSKNHDSLEPIDSTNIGHRLLEKIGWTPGNGLGLNQNGITTPVQIAYRHYRQGLGYENTSIDTSERMESEQPSSSTLSNDHASHL